MKADGLIDGRKIPDEVMNHLRKRAVHVIREDDHSPDVVAAALGFSRSCIYEWLNHYGQGRYEALKRHKPLGVEQGYDTVLWTHGILAELLECQFGVVVSGATVGLHLGEHDDDTKTTAIHVDRSHASLRYYG